MGMMNNTLNGRHPQYGIAGMINDNLGTQGYEVVRSVYNNLTLLHDIYSELSTIHYLHGSMPYVERVSQYVEVINKLQYNIEDIVGLNNNLPLIQDLVPKINTLKQNFEQYQIILQESNGKIDSLNLLYDEANLTIRNLIEDTKQRFNRVLEESLAEIRNELHTVLEESKQLYTTVKQQHSDLVANNHLLQDYLTTATENNKMLKHLMASDAVNTYLWEQNESHKQLAMEAIRVSEKAGNDEVTNRHKMKATKSDLNLFKVLNRNNLELANKTIAKSITQP